LFTNGRDNAFVPSKYREAFQHICAAKTLTYNHAGWSNGDVLDLVEVLKQCPNLEILNLNFNRNISDVGVNALATILPSLPHLQELGLINSSASKDSQERLLRAWKCEGKSDVNVLFDKY